MECLLDISDYSCNLQFRTTEGLEGLEYGVGEYEKGAVMG